MKELRTIYWDKNHVKIIDQNKLPHKLQYLQIHSYKQMIRAIKNMQIRGAPAIGIAGAFAVVLAARQKVNLAKAAKEIIAARPTAVNLAWAVKKIQGSRVSARGGSAFGGKGQGLRRAQSRRSRRKKIEQSLPLRNLRRKKVGKSIPMAAGRRPGLMRWDGRRRLRN
jgi:methylthioribose-1-phosphate isomerase